MPKHHHMVSFIFKRWREFSLLGVLLIIVLSAMWLQSHALHRLSTDLPKHVTTLIEAERALSTSHLWAEEIFAGDTKHHAGEVFGEIRRATLAFQELLRAHTSDEHQLNSPGINPAVLIVDVLESIRTYDALMQLRFDNQSSQTAASELDEQIDQLNWKIKRHADVLVDRYALETEHETTQFQKLTYVLLAILAIACGLCFIVYYRIESHRDGTWEALISAHRDIEEKNERLKDLVHRDGLTGLPNRTHVMEYLGETIVETRLTSKAFCLLLIDLDGFKDINDTLGHDFGDKLLEAVASRLIENAPRSSFIARPGGDEFMIVLPTCFDVDAAIVGAQTVIAAILSSFEKPFDLAGAKLSIGACIGIASYPLDASDRRTLIKNADLAMYAAKSRGRNRAVMYNEDIGRAFEIKSRLTQDMRHALKRRELFVIYQPFVRLSDCYPIGAEALLRWQHPELGLISPSDFIPVAEETGHIVEIGGWVLDEAIRQHLSWQTRGCRAKKISVNLSAVQIVEEDIVSRLTGLMIAHNLDDLSFLELEITESALMADRAVAKEMLRDIRALGARVAIDDFGTGYTSLSYLSEFEFDTLKLDRSIVSKVQNPGKERSILRAMVLMAQDLNIDIVAEGIETDAQRLIVTEAACTLGQGYLFSRPLPPLQALAHFRVAEKKVAICSPEMAFSQDALT